MALELVLLMYQDFCLENRLIYLLWAQASLFGCRSHWGLAAVAIWGATSFGLIGWLLVIQSFSHSVFHSHRSSMDCDSHQLDRFIVIIAFIPFSINVSSLKHSMKSISDCSAPRLWSFARPAKASIGSPSAPPPVASASPASSVRAFATPPPYTCLYHQPSPSTPLSASH